MKCVRTFLTVGLVLLVVWAGSSASAWAQSASEIEQIRAALPAGPGARPAAGRKLLVFTLCRGFPPSSIPYVSKAIQMMGERTHAFEAVVSDDIAMFEPGNLEQFDAILMNNTTGELFLPPDLGDLPEAEQAACREYDAMLKQSLVDFVRNGKGLAGIHAATDCFYQWPDYGEMIGGYFHGHPWHEPVTIKVDDPAHPVCGAFTGPTFQVTDEIYQFRDPYSRAKLRVLLSLDTARTDMDKGDAIHRTDGDFAVSWVRRYGKGRVFYCSLGHRNEILWNPTVLEHYLDGIQFVLGDLAADTTPSAELDPEYLDQSRAILEDRVVGVLLDQIAAYDYGQNMDAMRQVEDLVRRTHGAPEARERFAARLANMLDTDATAAAKRFACMQLSICGTESEAPALANLLGDPQMADMARYALERMPGPAAGNALREALERTTGDAQIGIINALGERRDEQAVARLAQLAAVRNTAVAEAAAHALGNIGGRRAIRALAELYHAPARSAAVADAYLCCIDGLMERGKTRQAAKRYEAVYASVETPHLRAAAFRGLAFARGARAVPMVLEALTSGERYLHEVARQCVLELPGADATDAFAAGLPELPPDTQILLICLLEERGDRNALPAMRAASSSAFGPVRSAALEALGTLGDVSCVVPLARTAATADRYERDIARQSLAALRGPDVDAKILACLSEALPAGPNMPIISDGGSSSERGANIEPAVRAELVRSLAARNVVSAVPRLLEIAEGPEPAIRTEAFNALAILGEPKDLPALLDTLARIENNADRDGAQQAVVAIARKFGDTEDSVKMLSDALSAVEDVSAKGALLRVLSRIGGDRALADVHAAMNRGEPALRDAAIRALAAWGDPVVLDELTDLAATADTETQRVLALRGLLRLIDQETNRAGKASFKMCRSLDVMLALCKRAMQLAEHLQEKRTVLSCVANVRTPGAKAFVRQYLDDPTLRAEAELAFEALGVAGPMATASHLPQVAHRAVDGDDDTRWDTGEPQEPGQWFMVDLGEIRDVAKVVLDTTKSGSDYPRAYEVFASTNQGAWRKVAAGQGASAVTEVAFPRTPARFIAVAQTAGDDVWFWSIHELIVE